jgi:hypothetical protein
MHATPDVSNDRTLPETFSAAHALELFIHRHFDERLREGTARNRQPFRAWNGREPSVRAGKDRDRGFVCMKSVASTEAESLSGLPRP